MFQNKQNTRIKYMFLICGLIFLFVIIKVFYIQVIEYKKLNTLANELWSRDLTVQADRGKILDRNGKVIVDNVTTVGLYLVPNQINNKEEVSKTLASILDVSYDEMYKHVSKKTSIERVHPEGRNISHEKADLINSYNYEGVYLLKESKRDYKYGNILSHVIGYTGIDNQGLSGIELKYDKILTGKNGNIKYYSDGKGKRLALPETYVSPTSGTDVKLTVDLDIQLSLENELLNAYKKYNADGAIGIVMNPKTGEVLAISSIPSFEPANYKNYSTEVINRNLAIWANFEPGSTFKIVTLASAINEGKVDIFKEHYYDKGSVKVANSTLHCWKRKGHGDQTFIQVVENSCNPGFVNLGQRLGKETLFKYITELGFGKKTGIDLNGEATGILFNLDKVGPVELATTAFGQGISVTALQQVTAVSAIVNGGTLYTPYIVSSIGNEQKSPVIKKENIVTKETSDVVRYALESVVANGSGRNAYIENYRIGGKTGTAQKVGSDGRYMQGNYVLSFIGFMPANDPEFVMYIAIDHAKGVTQYGGVVSAPIARNVLKDIISIYDIKEDSNGIPKSYRWDDVVYKMIPDVIGKNKKEAKKLLQGFKVEFTGDGDSVIDTSPNVNTRVKEGSTIKVLLN
ncbi:MAG: stage V sporulation protein D [Tenericutes bacterium]|nr:stage V sporulation protein D [Mycoplasmatota bacterium]